MTRYSVISLVLLCALPSLAWAQIIPKSDLTKADIVVNEKMTPADIKLIVDIVKFNREHLGRTPDDAPGVDVDKGTVRLTNADKTVRDAYIEQNVLGDGGNYPRFRMFCGSKFKYVFDAALFKGLKDVGPIADFHGQVIEGLWNACGNPPNAGNKAFANKIKTIHYKLTATQCTTHPYAKQHASYEYSLDEKTGEMTVGVCWFGPNNISESVISWISLQ